MVQDSTEDVVVESPWHESVATSVNEDDEYSLECGGGSNKDCFCQKMMERAFLRKLERRATVQFEWFTFWKELLYHTFFPFTLPLLALFEGGANGLINRQFWNSRLAISQWMYSIAFFMLNCLVPLYLSPDIVMVNILWIMRNMVLATKYGFISKGEMQEMREQVLPLQVHMDRTLVLAWTNPIPLQVLKREFLFSAARKYLIECTASLRIVPGASHEKVLEVMYQLSSKIDVEISSSRPTQGSGWGSFVDEEFGFNESFRSCPYCSRHGLTKGCFEDKWVDICMDRVCRGQGMCIPRDENFTGSIHSSQASEVDTPMREKPCPAIDVPALLLAAYVVQRSGDLLMRKNILHQIFTNPWRVYWASAAVAFIHAIIPFATRAIIGKPSTFGGIKWYHVLVSFSSLLINYSSMAASVMFMLAGIADFRRRYFSACLLNTLLKEGWCGEQIFPEFEKDKKGGKQKSLYHLGLVVDFSDPRSIAGWWAIRMLVQDFGLVFHKRVKQYAGYFALYCTLLMGFLIIELFANGTKTAIYILAVVIYDLLIFVGLLCLMVFPGGAANDMNHEQGATLVRKKMLMATKLRSSEDMHPQDRKTLQFALEVLQTISQAVYWQNTTTKVTILGFTAGGELIAVLIGVGSAAIGIAAQQLTSRIH